MRPNTAARTDKPWGYELLWAKTNSYAGKVLHVDAGQRLSKQYHRFKDEWQYVLSGQVVLEITEGTAVERVSLSPGEGLHIPAGTVHRLIAVTDADVLEVSTPELDDVVRLEDQYGRADALEEAAAR